jgi:hypothetical protein
MSFKINIYYLKDSYIYSLIATAIILINSAVKCNLVRSIDAGLVLSGNVIYELPSVMGVFYTSNLTLINLVTSLLLKNGFDYFSISLLIIFISQLCFYFGAFYFSFSITKSKKISFLISLISLIFMLNIGKTDYPVMFITEHIYGILAMAFATLIYGLIAANKFKIAVIAVLFLTTFHIVTGVIFSFLILLGYLHSSNLLTKIINNKFIYLIIFFSILIFIFIFLQLNLYKFDENFIVFIEMWDYHRSQIPFNFIYIFISLIIFALLFIYSNYGILFKENKPIKNSGIFVLQISIFLFLIFYLLKDFYPIWLKIPMLNRLSVLYSYIVIPVMASVAYKYVINYIPFRIVKYFIFIVLLCSFIVFYLSFSKFLMHKPYIDTIANTLSDPFNQVKLLGNGIKELQLKFHPKQAVLEAYEEAKELSFGEIVVTTSSTSRSALLFGKFPILLDVSSFDFVSYLPDLALPLRNIVEQVYGVDYSRPPIFLRNKGSISDLFVKEVFEKRSQDEWVKLGNEFNFSLVIVPRGWRLNLNTVSIGDSFEIFFVPKYAIK